MIRQNLREHLAGYYGGKSISPETANRLQLLAQVDEQGHRHVPTSHIPPRWLQPAFAAAACMALVMSSVSLYLIQKGDGQGDNLEYLLTNPVSHRNVGASMQFANHPTPNLVAVKYQIQGCPLAAECEPVFVGLVDKFGEQPVIFCRYDMTNQTTRAQSHNLASVLGVDWAYEGPRQSGTILLIDRESRKVLARLTEPRQIAQLEEAIICALPDS